MQALAILIVVSVCSLMCGKVLLKALGRVLIRLVAGGIVILLALAAVGLGSIIGSPGSDTDPDAAASRPTVHR